MSKEGRATPDEVRITALNRWIEVVVGQAPQGFLIDFEYLIRMFVSDLDMWREALDNYAEATDDDEVGKVVGIVREDREEGSES